jgi:catalase
VPCDSTPTAVGRETTSRTPSTGRSRRTGLPVSGISGTHEWGERETDDFAQAGALYRLIDNSARRRLIDNIADGLAKANHSEIVDRSVSCFRKADPDYGRSPPAVAENRLSR